MSTTLRYYRGDNSIIARTLKPFVFYRRANDNKIIKTKKKKTRQTLYRFDVLGYYIVPTTKCDLKAFEAEFTIARKR